MLALIGGGYWGKNLIRNFHKLGVLSIVCDTNTAELELVEKEYPSVRVTNSYSDIINDPKLRAVAIATPAEMHHSMVKAALLKGKDVFVEKPLALKAEEGEELNILAHEKKLILMVGHLLHYHAAYIKLKEMALTGKLGKINYIYSNRLNLGKIRREENILLSFAPHDISMILGIANELPESVSATGGYYLNHGIADTSMSVLSFKGGAKAHIFVSWLHPFKEQKLVVVGDRKMAVFDDIMAWEEKLVTYSHEIVWKTGIPVPKKVDAERISLEQTEPLLNECSQFVEAIKSRKPSVTDGAEGLRVLKVLNAAQFSLKNNGAPVSLSKMDMKVINPEPLFFAHETAIIDDGVEIDKGTKIWHFSHILKGSRIGKNCNIGQNVVIGPKVTVGEGCKIQNNVSLYQGVTLEDHVFCGPSMVFTNVFNPRSEIRRMDELRPTLVRRGATLGANCTIVCGVDIGKYALVGAGAVVTKDIPDYALVVGNPARRVGWVCMCGEKLSTNEAGGATCSNCYKQYALYNNHLRALNG